MGIGTVLFWAGFALLMAFISLYLVAQFRAWRDPEALDTVGFFVTTVRIGRRYRDLGVGGRRRTHQKFSRGEVPEGERERAFAREAALLHVRYYRSFLTWVAALFMAAFMVTWPLGSLLEGSPFLFMTDPPAWLWLGFLAFGLAISVVMAFEYPPRRRRRFEELLGRLDEAEAAEEPRARS